MKNNNLRVFDTLSKTEREFVPQVAGNTPHDSIVTFYHCGPTVYWTQHIGNLRGMTMGDVIRRTLLYWGYQVKYVRNYTDVGHLTGDNLGDADSGEDRMTKGALRENTTPDAIAAKYIQQFEEDTAAINLLVPDAKPRATEYIRQMQTLAQELLAKGYAYTTPLAVYFDVTKFPGYTQLSRQKLEFNKQGAGQGDVSDPEKHHPQDFALWFFKAGTHANALQAWQSPFTSKLVENGRGFPGWHIECSAMSLAELGETLDIHMGGVEHIPVHHTNEIAQSEAANDAHYVNYWLHNEHLLVDGKKMSKSEGTSYTLKDIVDKGFEPLVLRYFFLNAHYRSKQNFTWQALEAASNSLANLRGEVVKLIPDQNSQTTAGAKPNVDWQARFRAALAADFNTPAALAVLWDLLKSDLSNDEKYATVLDFDQVFGLKLSEVKPKNTGTAHIDDETKQKIQHLIEQRTAAKAAKNYSQSDEIRNQLRAEFNVELTDSPSGTEWTIVE